MCDFKPPETAADEAVSGGFSLCGIPESIDGAPKKENGQEKRKIAAHFCDIFGGVLVESEDEKCYNKLIYYAHQRGWQEGEYSIMAAKNKIGFIATARCIGILLVVFGHSYPFEVYIPPALWAVNGFIYTFHMPLFLFLSGYLVTLNTRSTVSYIRRRCVRLLIPYFALSIIAFIPKTMVQQFLNDSVELSVWYLIKTELVPRDNVWGHFWYIPVAFTLSFIGILMVKYMRKIHPVGWMALAASWLILFLPRTTDWFALEDLRKTTFYFTLGMMLAIWDPESRVVSSRYWLLGLPAAVVLFAVVNTIMTNSLIALLMIGFVLHIGGKLPLREKGLFACIEKNSFTIFLLSWPAQAVAEVVCNKLLHLPALLTMGMMFLAGIAVPLICVSIVSWMEKRIPMKWVKLIIGM